MKLLRLKLAPRASERKEMKNNVTIVWQLCGQLHSQDQSLDPLVPLVSHRASSRVRLLQWTPTHSDALNADTPQRQATNINPMLESVEKDWRRQRGAALGNVPHDFCSGPTMSERLTSASSSGHE
jgi:hypothetical protein